MKTLHRYLLRQIIASTVLTAAVFTFVLLLGSALRELLPLLISQHATFGLMAKAFSLLIPFVWVFAMPMGLLTATLLVFGRFSADQELTAARASGISLLSLAAPVLVMSLLFCGLSAFVNMQIAPSSRVAYNQLRFEMRSALANLHLPAGRVIKEFPNYLLYIGKSEGPQIQDVLLYQLTNGTPNVITHAPSGELQWDKSDQKLVLRLHDAQMILGPEAMTLQSNLKLELDLNKSKEAMGTPSISDLTFTQLREKLAETDRLLALPTGGGQVSSTNVQNDLRALERHRSHLSVQIHREVAFSFACFGFTLIGIPLGIRMHRRETNVGVAVALGLVAVYYTFTIISQALADKPQYAPELFMWAPNFLFQAIGAVLLWRADRGI